jgi:hypothetical protein
MSFWSLAAPLATIGASAFGGPVAGMAAGAVMGGMKHDEDQKRRQQQLNAQADAEQVGWARRDGRGSVPMATQQVGSQMGDVLSGGVGGYMQGQAFKKDPIDWTKMFGSGGGGVPPTEAEAAFGSKPSLYGNSAMPLPFR